MDKSTKTINQNEVVTPSQCHLWTKDELVWNDIFVFEDIERYIDESDCKRKLVKCSECNQLYYYEFYETQDWNSGNDPQYRTIIPIKDKTVAEKLNDLTSIELLSITPRMQFDSKDTEEAGWVR